MDLSALFSYQEGSKALSVDIESVFLKLQTPKQYKIFLRFLWRPKMNKNLGVKNSSTIANCALKRVSTNDQDEPQLAAKAILNNLYLDELIESVDTPEEAINVFKQQQHLLSKTLT